MNSLSLDLRPTKLEDIVGHTEIKQALQKQLASGRVPTAWLFSGPSGCGKSTLAFILARSLPGNEGLGGQLDMQVENGSDKNGVDDARGWAEASAYRPMAGRYKVLLIDEAHQLTAAAQNTLLIPTERQDSPTIFIFCTTDPQKLLPALKSRCLHFDLRGLDAGGVQQLVSRAALSTKWTGDPTPFIDHMVKAGVTSPRTILMAFEKHMGGTPPEKCVVAAENEPVYKDIAVAVLAGNWPNTSRMLTQIQTPDARALRAIVAGFLRAALLREPVGSKADAIATCVVGLGSSAFEDGVAWATTCGLLYKTCKAIGGAK